MASFTRRYRSGDRDAVWHELRVLGASVRGPDSLDDAREVARIAMTRARDNVVTIIERLTARNYQFGDPRSDGGAQVPLAPPDSETPAFVEWLEQRFGPLPLTARAWIEIVGDVSLLGEDPAWPDDAVPDPLVVEFEYKSWKSLKPHRVGTREYFVSEFEAWKDSAASPSDNGGPFTLDVAPDHLHKADISGGLPYGVFVPDGSADGLFRYEDDLCLPFVEYLKQAFRHGGFPGLRNHPEAWSLRRDLSSGLLQI